MQPSQCPSCGAAIAPGSGGWDASGRFVCASCQARSQVADRIDGHGRWPAWGIALLSFVCNPMMITTIMAILRAREELTLAATLDANGDTTRASSVRSQAWLAIGLASVFPVLGCTCFIIAMMMNVVGAAAGHGGGYDGY